MRVDGLPTRETHPVSGRGHGDSFGLYDHRWVGRNVPDVTIPAVTWNPFAHLREGPRMYPPKGGIHGGAVTTHTSATEKVMFRCVGVKPGGMRQSSFPS